MQVDGTKFFYHRYGAWLCHGKHCKYHLVRTHLTHITRNC